MEPDSESVKTRFAARLLLSLPGGLLAATAIVCLISGIAIDRTFPVPVYIRTNIELPRISYEEARDVLSSASRWDGEAKVEQSEAAFFAGDPPMRILPTLESALALAPSSAKGWTLLAELRAPSDSRAAALALALALQLAPLDYWLGTRRALVGAMLWDDLDPDGRNTLLRQTRLLWEEQPLREGVNLLADTDKGAALLGRAFASQPDTLRLINRITIRASLHDFISR